MAVFTYTYDLNRSELKGHLLATGVGYTQRLIKEVGEAQKSRKRFEALVYRWETLKKVKAPTQDQQEEQILLKKAIEYVKAPDIIGRQLQQDIIRPGFDVVFQGVQKGNKIQAKEAAKEFMQGLSLPQQLLVDQSQGLLSPTTHFLSQSLTFPQGQALNANALSIGQGVFLKSDKDIQIIRQDDFYSFNDQALDNMDSARFYYKVAGKPLQSSLISQESALYKALRETLHHRHSQNGIVCLTYLNEKQESLTLQIEPILSVSHQIKMGQKADSLQWSTKMTLHDELAKLDKVFEAHKLRVVKKNHPIKRPLSNASPLNPTPPLILAFVRPQSAPFKKPKDESLFRMLARNRQRIFVLLFIFIGITCFFGGVTGFAALGILGMGALFGAMVGALFASVVPFDEGPLANLTDNFDANVSQVKVPASTIKNNEIEKMGSKAQRLNQEEALSNPVSDLEKSFSQQTHKSFNPKSKI